MSVNIAAIAGVSCLAAFYALLSYFVVRRMFRTPP